jgi:hypothetical protein
VTIPNYLATFRQAVREREASEKSPTLISSISFISSPGPSQSGDGQSKAPQTGQLKRIGGAYEKNELNEKRVAPSFPYADALDHLDRRCPDHIEAKRWQQCVVDASRFIASWGDKALALGWTADELFGLHSSPARPRPSYSRLSRYDHTGLLWLLQGCRVIALTNTTAAISTPSGGTLTYRKLRKPAFGPLGDSLDDFTGGDGPEAA